MMRRNLQSAGGTGGTLFSALMLVIIVICFITYCYRRSIYNFNNRGRHDVEVIIEASADICDADANFAEVGGVSDPIPAPSGVNSDAVHEAERKKNVLLWLNDTIRSSNENSCCNSVEIAIAYEYDLTRGGTSVVQARPIRVMESFQNSDTASDSHGNADYPFHDVESDRNHHNDYDYLIETERNMHEFNNDFDRIASSNEAALALSTALLEAQQSNATRSAEAARPSLDETDTALPVNLNVDNSGSQRVYTPRRGPNASMFFSTNSANRTTLIGDRHRRNNDVCAQQ